MINLRDLQALYPRWPFIAAGLLLIAGGLIWLFTGPATTQIDSYKQCATAGYPLTDTNPPACDAGSQVFLGPAATPEPSSPPITSQTFQVLVDGDSEGNYPKGEQVITNQADWQKYWRTVNAALPSMPPLLPVDFASQNVIALSSGREVTTGYTLEVTSITTSTTGSVVSVTESIPSITCAVTNAPSNRYFIAATAKLPSPVVFQLTTEHRQCP